MKRLLLAGLLLLGACDPSTLGPSDQGDDETYTVTYEVSGAESADVTYENENADTSQEAGISLPWTYSFDAPEGSFVYISAQNNGGGTITCSISVDGGVVESNDSSGEFAICTASGAL
jgi:hypothetical protein